MADGLFDRFKDGYENRHDYARAWKGRTSGQVVATMCAYSAEDLPIASALRGAWPATKSPLTACCWP